VSLSYSSAILLMSTSHSHDPRDRRHQVGVTPALGAGAPLKLNESSAPGEIRVQNIASVILRQPRVR
jgi:hypothetical protein